MVTPRSRFRRRAAGRTRLDILVCWPDATIDRAALAQLVEHLICNQAVPGSSPGGGSNIKGCETMGCESIGLVTHCSFLEEIHPKFTHPPLRQVTSGALRLVSGSHNSPSSMPVSIGFRPFSGTGFSCLQGLEGEVKPNRRPSPQGWYMYPIHAPPSTAIESARPVVLHQPRPWCHLHQASRTARSNRGHGANFCDLGILPPRARGSAK